MSAINSVQPLRTPYASTVSPTPISISIPRDCDWRGRERPEEAVVGQRNMASSSHSSRAERWMCMRPSALLGRHLGRLEDHDWDLAVGLGLELVVGVPVAVMMRHSSGFSSAVATRARTV